MSNKYGWIITWIDNSLFDVKELGIMGPYGLTATAEEVKNQGQHFRMYDDDGNLYYEGYCLGDDLFAPLDDFGRPNAGCTEIHYKNEEGYWDIL